MARPGGTAGGTSLREKMRDCLRKKMRHSRTGTAALISARAGAVVVCQLSHQRREVEPLPSLGEKKDRSAAPGSGARPMAGA